MCLCFMAGWGDLGDSMKQNNFQCKHKIKENWSTEKTDRFIVPATKNKWYLNTFSCQLASNGGNLFKIAYQPL